MEPAVRAELLAGLAADREALLAVAARVEEHDLKRGTRNSEWAVRDVLAHVVACDTDLIMLLGPAGDPTTTAIRGRSVDAYEREVAGWRDATPEVFVRELRERGERWRGLLDGLPDGAFSKPTQETWARAERPLDVVVADWRAHDEQHGEDVRLAIEEGRTGGE